MGTSFGRDRHTTTSLHLLSTSRRITIKMNSAILLALFASAAYANPAANPLCALVDPMNQIFAAVDGTCSTNCAGDPDNSCPADMCTVPTTLAAGNMAAAQLGMGIKDLIAMGDGCLDYDMYLAAAADVQDGEITAPESEEAKDCLLGLAAKLNEACPAAPVAMRSDPQ